MERLSPGSLTVHIQAVPERRFYVERAIIPAVQKGGDAVDQIALWEDHQKHGPLWNATRIWHAIAGDTLPGLVLQDDTILHADFWDHMPDIMAHVASGDMEAVSLFAPPRALAREAFAMRCNFIESYNFLWMPAMLLTPNFCVRLLEWIVKHPSETVHDDVVMGAFGRQTGTPIWVALPSLVQHDLNLKSTMGTAKAIAGKKRRSEVWTKDIVAGWYRLKRTTQEGRGHDA
jgi:hypothetical protein